jgi:hypothetical protein
MSYSECTVEVPERICTQLRAKLTATLLEVPAHTPTNVINVNQAYVVRVCVELGSEILKLLCGEWCISVAVESCGASPDFKLTKVISMDNCTPGPDCWDFRIDGRDFGLTPEECGNVFHFCITVVARDSCEHRPIGIAGFCKLGPVMVYSG